MVYREGILGWARSGLELDKNVKYPNRPIPLISARTLLESNGSRFQIIDLRPRSHFNRGHIHGSTHIDLEELHLRINQISRKRPIVLVDHKGKLTLTTGRFLVSQGIEEIFRLDGGFNAWVKDFTYL